MTKPWETVPLCRLGSFAKGSGVSKSDLVSDGIRAIRYGELYTTYNTSIHEVASRIPSDHTSACYRIERGDILFPCSGETAEDIGRPAVYLNDAECYAGGDIIVFRLTAGNPLFLAYALNSTEAVRFRAARAKGHTVVHIYADDLGEFPVQLPPDSEQQKIAAILSTWDRAIELTDKLIAAKQQRKAALVQQLLTGRVRLPGFTGEWPSSRIGRFLTESRIAGSAGDSAQKLTVKLYGKGVIPKADTRPGSAETRYYRRRAGQFIYSKLDFLNGAFGLIPAELDGYESTLDLPAFDVGNDVDPRWFLRFVVRESFYKTGLSLANGGRKARRVNPADFLKSEVPFPHRQEQQAIAEVIDTQQREIFLLSRKLDALRRQKKGLMQQLLTGKVRVNVTEPSGA
jgi:type I restriction enzyme, S subunit